MTIPSCILPCIYLLYSLDQPEIIFVKWNINILKVGAFLRILVKNIIVILAGITKTKVLRLVSTSDFQKYNAKDNSFAYWEHKTQTNKHVN
jgi:hypothetical protein